MSPKKIFVPLWFEDLESIRKAEPVIPSNKPIILRRFNFSPKKDAAKKGIRIGVVNINKAPCIGVERDRPSINKN